MISHDQTDNPPLQVSLVLGASGGIGSTLAELLMREGHQLGLAARTTDRAREAASDADTLPIAFDATDSESVHAALRETADHFGRLDAVALCVGSLLLKPAHRTSPEEWRDVIDVNLTAAFNTVRAAADVMDGGSVVLVASAAAEIGLPNHEAIAAAKAGVIGLARAAAASYASRHLRVNVVSPGMTDTPMTVHLTGNKRMLEQSVAMHALGRIGEPVDVARAIAWFMDRRNDWVTGQVLGVDGGLARINRGPRAARRRQTAT